MDVNLTGIPAMLQKVTFASLIPALLYMTGGLVVVRLVMKALTHALERSGIDKTLHKFLLTIARLLLYFIVFMTVAGALGIQITSFVAVLSVAGLAISLSLQGVLGNLSSGIMLLSVKPFRVGDYVEVGGLSGTVAEIGFIYTKIMTADNRIIYIPNTQVSGAQITNYTQENRRRVDLVFKAGYDSSPEEVKAALLEALAQFPAVLADPAPFVRVSGYGDSVEYAVRVWCATENYWGLYHDVIETVPAAYARHGVSMSYPHYNLHIAKDSE